MKTLFFFSGFKCSDDKFTCNNGECVKKNLLCDGDFACKDGSDEDNCECPISMFNCKGGGCLLATSVCDGTNDCSNGDDEKNCRKLLSVFTLTIVNRETWQEKKETEMTRFMLESLRPCTTFFCAPTRLRNRNVLIDKFLSQK